MRIKSCNYCAQDVISITLITMDKIIDRVFLMQNAIAVLRILMLFALFGRRDKRFWLILR